jgi:hypothetical protein
LLISLNNAIKTESSLIQSSGGHDALEWKVKIAIMSIKLQSGNLLVAVNLHDSAFLSHQIDLRIINGRFTSIKRSFEQVFVF